MKGPEQMDVSETNQQDQAPSNDATASKKEKVLRDPPSQVIFKARESTNIDKEEFPREEMPVRRQAAAPLKDPIALIEEEEDESVPADESAVSRVPNKDTRRNRYRPPTVD